MKKVILSLFVVATVSISFAQERNYNSWSIELEGGVHKPAQPFTPGYYAATPSFWQAGVGFRYMFNESFGTKLDFGYQNIQNHDSSMPFETDFMRVTLQGVVNAGSVLNFRSWTNRFNILAHAGFGYGINTPKAPIEYDSGDQMLVMIAGITPQLRLSNRVVLSGDLSALGNVRHSIPWDGAETNLNNIQSNNEVRGLNGYIVNASIGLTFYLGANDVHADWYSEAIDTRSQMDDMENRLSKIETDLIDSDQDGVPDYLDREPNTPSGVAVDSKGRALDKNNNGIPDEWENGLDARYALKSEIGTGTGTDGASMTIKELIDKGYVNVYFRFDSDQPEIYSLQAVNYLVIYMKENPGANAELIGYADEIGDPGYNQRLSERRANKVKELLIAAGIAESRLTVTAGGEDASVDKDSSGARQLVRRVTFRLR